VATYRQSLSPVRSLWYISDWQIVTMVTLGMLPQPVKLSSGGFDFHSSPQFYVDDLRFTESSTDGKARAGFSFREDRG
jgi:hypothetical protein